MRKIIALIMLVSLIGLTTPVFADNVFDDISDTLKGRNEDLPLNLYVAYTTKGTIPLLPANLRIKVESPYGEEFLERGELSIGLEF